MPFGAKRNAGAALRLVPAQRQRGVAHRHHGNKDIVEADQPTELRRDVMAARCRAQRRKVCLAAGSADPNNETADGRGLRISLDFGRIESHNPKERGGAATCGSRTRCVRLQWPRP